MTKTDRRNLSKLAAVAATATAAAQISADQPIRVGFVGVGGRGSGLLRNLLKLEKVEVVALCDINEENLTRAQSMVTEAGQTKPEGYSRGETDFRRLCDRNDLDLVITATPWQWHTPVSVAAMNAGKHAATEVPAAQTVEQCWQLVETSEKTGKQCTILENDCYYRYVLFTLNIIRAGLLGRSAVRRSRLHARHPRREIRSRTQRRALAHRAVGRSQRQPVSYPSHRPAGVVDGHQPRRPVRLLDFDEHKGPQR